MSISSIFYACILHRYFGTKKLQSQRKASLSTFVPKICEKKSMKLTSTDCPSRKTVHKNKNPAQSFLYCIKLTHNAVFCATEIQLHFKSYLVLSGTIWSDYVNHFQLFTKIIFHCWLFRLPPPIYYLIWSERQLISCARLNRCLSFHFWSLLTADITLKTLIYWRMHLAM